MGSLWVFPGRGGTTPRAMMPTTAGLNSSTMAVKSPGGDTCASCADDGATRITRQALRVPTNVMSRTIRMVMVFFIAFVRPVDFHAGPEGLGMGYRSLHHVTQACTGFFIPSRPKKNHWRPPGCSSARRFGADRHEGTKAGT